MSRRLNLRNIDLNLLPILNALIEHQSVKGASQQVHLSQSATSSALRRIRDTFNDPILEPNGAKLKLSEKATLIGPRLRENLESTVEILNELIPIDLNSTARKLTISGPEHAVIVIPHFLQNVLNDSINDVTFELTDFHFLSALEDVKSGKIDFAIGPFEKMTRPDGVECKKLYEENLVVSLRQDHPAIGDAVDGRMTLASFEYYQHLLASNDDAREGSALTELIKQKNIHREVHAKLSSLLMIPSFLKSSDMISLGTERATKEFSAVMGLSTLMPPSELISKPFNIHLAWRSSSDNDALYQQTKNGIIEATSSLDPLN